MYNVNGFAIRTDKQLSVTVFGSLSNGNSAARIIGSYPGSVEHIVDPGYAEIWIEETSKGAGEVTMAILPWGAKVELDDDRHDKVLVRVNGKVVKVIEIANADDKKRGGIEDAMNDYADSVSDFIREHNIGWEAGRKVADKLDDSTGRKNRPTKPVQ